MKKKTIQGSPRTKAKATSLLTPCISDKQFFKKTYSKKEKGTVSQEGPTSMKLHQKPEKVACIMHLKHSKPPELHHNLIEICDMVNVESKCMFKGTIEKRSMCDMKNI